MNMHFTTNQPPPAKHLIDVMHDFAIAVGEARAQADMMQRKLAAAQAEARITLLVALFTEAGI